MRDEWEARTTIDPLRATGVQEARTFWHAQDIHFALYIQQLLDVPTVFDAGERPFAKAGVLDTMRHNQSHPLLRKASVMLFCNGGGEWRFSHA